MLLLDIVLFVLHFDYVILLRMPHNQNSSKYQVLTKKMLTHSYFSRDSKKKFWNNFKWLLIIQLGADWLPVMCWPFKVQFKSMDVSAPRGATVILGRGSSCRANVSRALLHIPRIKTSQYAQQLHSGGERMHGMCLQHHNSSLLSHGLIWPSQEGIGQ